jgi:hypothetical protein
MRSISEFSSGCAHRLVLVLLLEEGQVRQDVHAVDAAVRPEVQHQHAAPQLLQRQHTQKASPRCPVPNGRAEDRKTETLEDHKKLIMVKHAKRGGRYPGHQICVFGSTWLIHWCRSEQQRQGAVRFWSSERANLLSFPQPNNEQSKDCSTYRPRTAQRCREDSPW